MINGHLDEVVGDLRVYASTPAWRTAAFRQLVLEDPELDGIANSFQRAWLVEVYKHAHVSYGLDHDDLAASSVSAGQRELGQGDGGLLRRLRTGQNCG